MQNSIVNTYIAVLVGREFLLYGFSMPDILCFYPCPSKVAKIEHNKNSAFMESRNVKAFVYSRDVNAHAKINTCRYSCKKPLKLYEPNKYLILIGQTSIYTKSVFRTTRSNFELKSTLRFAMFYGGFPQALNIQ
jgi:hypothetical protein